MVGADRDHVLINIGKLYFLIETLLNEINELDEPAKDYEVPDKYQHYSIIFHDLQSQMSYAISKLK